jgi:hypothetical protein
VGLDRSGISHLIARPPLPTPPAHALAPFFLLSHPLAPPPPLGTALSSPHPPAPALAPTPVAMHHAQAVLRDTTQYTSLYTVVSRLRLIRPLLQMPVVAPLITTLQTLISASGACLRLHSEHHRHTLICMTRRTLAAYTRPSKIHQLLTSLLKKSPPVTPAPPLHRTTTIIITTLFLPTSPALPLYSVAIAKLITTYLDKHLPPLPRTHRHCCIHKLAAAFATILPCTIIYIYLVLATVTLCGAYTMSCYALRKIPPQTLLTKQHAHLIATLIHYSCSHKPYHQRPIIILLDAVTKCLLLSPSKQAFVANLAFHSHNSACTKLRPTLISLSSLTALTVLFLCSASHTILKKILSITASPYSFSHHMIRLLYVLIHFEHIIAIHRHQLTLSLVNHLISVGRLARTTVRSNARTTSI